MVSTLISILTRQTDRRRRTDQWSYSVVIITYLGRSSDTEREREREEVREGERWGRSDCQDETDWY